MNAMVEVVERDADGWAQLQERESRIERAQRNAYLEIGLELRAIRDAGLYKTARPQAIAGRTSFETWAEYCASRWDFDDRRARALIEVASVSEKIGEISPVMPGRESHVRPLLKLETDAERATVWQSIVDQHGSSVTAKEVEAAVSSYQAANGKAATTPSVRQSVAVPVEPAAERLAAPIAEPSAGEAPQVQAGASAVEDDAAGLWSALRDLEHSGCLSGHPARLFDRLTDEQQEDVRRIVQTLSWWTPMLEGK